MIKCLMCRNEIDPSNVANVVAIPTEDGCGFWCHEECYSSYIEKMMKVETDPIGWDMIMNSMYQRYKIYPEQKMVAVFNKCKEYDGVSIKITMSRLPFEDNA